METFRIILISSRHLSNSNLEQGIIFRKMLIEVGVITQRS